MDTTDDVVQRLAGAIVARDFDAVEALFAPDARFRALTPSALREADSASGAADLFRKWFGDSTELRVESATAAPLLDRSRMAYRIAGTDEDGPFVVEQQAYYDVEDGRLTTMTLVCSGFRPVHAEVRGSHRFDAGVMGCTDGLSQEFRRRIGSIPVGDVLEVVARDPSARTDLPSLARLMGHRVVAVDEETGVLTISVERAK